jgi:hypothetical protein
MGAGHLAGRSSCLLVLEQGGALSCCVIQLLPTRVRSWSTAGLLEMGTLLGVATWPSRAGDAPMLARAWRSGGAGNTCDDDVDGREGRLSMWGGGSGAAGYRELRTRDSYGLD